MARSLVRLALFVALFSALSVARAAADVCPGADPGSGCTTAPTLGNFAGGQPIFRQPQALALDAAGNLFVGDRWGYAFQRFDPNRAPTGAWGEYGDGDGQFGAIGGLAVGADGSVFALDIDQNRVEKFVPDGAGGYRFARAWGGRGSDGSGPADFDIRFTGDIGVSPSGRVYVADPYNQRVAWYDSNGRYLGQLGVVNVTGSDAGHFRYPEGVGFDEAGDVYVADDRNDRVQKFSSAGNLLASIGLPGELNNPYDVGVDAAGNVYVADNLNDRVVKYQPDASGTSYTLAAAWGGQMVTPRSIVVAADGTNIVTDTGNGRVETFDANGNLLGSLGVNGRDGGRVTGPMGLALDPTGSLLVADALQYRVQRLGLDMSPLGFIGSHGDDPDQLWQAESSAPAADGGIWVADTGNDRVQHFDPAGDVEQVVPGFRGPRGIATAPDGSVYVADTGDGRVVHLDQSGNVVTSWNGSAGLRAPTDVARDPQGRVLVVDQAAQRVVVLDGGGNRVGDWGGEGSDPNRRGPGGFLAPTGIDVDGAGNVYVADPGAARVSKYAPDGTWLASMGARGHAIGKFWTGGPRDVALTPSGLLASDPYANELEQFDLPPASYTPALGTARAGDVGAASAAVLGAVDTHGLTASYWVEFGNTKAYGRRAAFVASGGGGRLTLRLAGLATRHRYHYRVVAASAAGKSYGADGVFTTTPAVILRAAAQKRSAAIRKGLAVRIRAGERTRLVLQATISRRDARKLRLRGTVVAKLKRSARRNTWTTVHVRFTRAARSALTRRPRALAVRIKATSAKPRGSATRTLRIR